MYFFYHPPICIINVMLQPARTYPSRQVINSSSCVDLIGVFDTQYNNNHHSFNFPLIMTYKKLSNLYTIFYLMARVVIKSITLIWNASELWNTTILMSVSTPVGIYRRWEKFNVIAIYINYTNYTIYFNTTCILIINYFNLCVDN